MEFNSVSVIAYAQAHVDGLVHACVNVSVAVIATAIVFSSERE